MIRPKSNGLYKKKAKTRATSTVITPKINLIATMLCNQKEARS